MRKKWFNRMLSAVLATVMVFSMAACGNEKETNKTESSESKVVSETKKETEKAETVPEETTGEITYPVSSESELSFWVGQQLTLASEYSSWEESPFHSGLYERTGVKVDYLYPAKGADVAQSYTLLWAEKELPDLVLYNMGLSEASQYIEDEVIWDLTEYLPKYAPNYWNYINAPEQAAEKAAATLADGTFWSIPSMREDNVANTWQGHIIRQDWLEECGLEAPVTIADWEEVLVAFKEKYGATYGFRMGYTGGGAIASGFGALGFLDGYAFRVDNNGKVVFPAVTDETKAMVETFAKWFDMGLIDRDILTLNDDGVRQKALDNELGIILTKASAFGLIMGDAESNNPDAKWRALAYPRTAPGVPTSEIYAGQNRLTGYHTVITKGHPKKK